MRDCENCVYKKADGCSRWECEFVAKDDCFVVVGTPMPKFCAECPLRVQNIEEQDGRYEVWYECRLIDGCARKGEKLNGCPLREVEE